MIEDIIRDVKYGFRLLLRKPGFMTVVVLALALGIGVNAAVFTAYKAMVLRGLDGRDPGRLVNVALTRQSGATSFTFSYPDYEAYRDSLSSFTGVIAYLPERLTLSSAGTFISQRTSMAEVALGRLGLFPSGAANAEFASTYVVSENYFAVLGVKAVRGRTFESIAPRDLIASPPALIGERYWQQRFAGDPAILGKSVRLNGVAVTIVGITPRDFVGTSVAEPDFWLPIALEPLIHANDTWLRDRENERCRMFARLAPGVTIERAQAEMNVVADRIRTLHDSGSPSAKPASAIVWRGSPFPLPLRLYPGLRLTILLVMAAAAMVLVVACANVGSLQLARGRSRQDELHTRLALGATRLRVIRQLLTESALLGLFGGGVALFFTWALLKIAVTWLGSVLPVDYGTLVFDVAPDLGIFAYVCVISMVAGMLFGLAPAIESSRAALIASTRMGSSTTRSRRIQDMLVAAKVSLSLVLLFADSLLIRSAMQSLKMNPGYETKRVVALNIQFPEASKGNPGHRQAMIRELRTRLAALPRVVAVTSARPPGDLAFRTAAASPSGERSSLQYRYVQSNYFQTVGVPLVMGRGFRAGGAQTEGAIVVSESAARQFWPGQNPVGRSLRLGITDERVHNLDEMAADGPVYDVIGVARDTRGVQFDGSDAKQIYLPLPDDRLENQPVLLRTDSDPADLIKAVDGIVASIDPDLLVTSSTLDEMLRQSAPFIVSSLAAGVASVVGLLGLFLAAMGIYGTVRYIVSLRTREVGIRIALGAEKRDILSLILRESARPVIGGLAVGLVLAPSASFLLRGVLFGVSPLDGISFIGVSVTLLMIALLAAYPPARRALRIDPAVALRCE